jgi:hypothetical protein
MQTQPNAPVRVMVDCDSKLGGDSRVTAPVDSTVTSMAAPGPAAVMDQVRVAPVSGSVAARVPTVVPDAAFSAVAKEYDTMDGTGGSFTFRMFTVIVNKATAPKGSVAEQARENLWSNASSGGSGVGVCDMIPSAG